MGYSDYHNLKGQAFRAGEDAGNSTIDGVNYAIDYDLLDVGLEFGAKLGGLPMKLGAAYARNLEADKKNTGVSAGLTVGKAKKANTIQASVVYQKIQQDAVLGAFTNSDFNGGGTGGEGFVLNSKFVVNDEVSISLTELINSTTGADKSGRYTTQFDVNYKF